MDKFGAVQILFHKLKQEADIISTRLTCGMVQSCGWIMFVGKQKELVIGHDDNLTVLPNSIAPAYACLLGVRRASRRKGFDGAEPVARLGLLLSDTAASHGNALKELLQLVKLGLLTCDAAASQKQGRCGAESVDEARSHAERHSCITKKYL